MRLDGKRIIVTGGAGGIGAAAVATYVREGARVVATDVDDARGASLAEATGAEYLHCDVANAAEVRKVFAAAAESLQGLDVLAHLAGIERDLPASDIGESEWDLVLDVNGKGTLLTNQEAFRLMRDAGGGSIINAGSGGGIRGQPNSAHYAASKGAVMAWTRTVAQEWGRYGVRVNCLAPAAWTPMYEAFRSRMSPNELAIHDLTMQHMVLIGGRLGDPERDIAPVLVFLASDDSRFVTGQVISVDGGLVMLGS